MIIMRISRSRTLRRAAARPLVTGAVVLAALLAVSGLAVAGIFGFGDGFGNHRVGDRDAGGVCCCRAASGSPRSAIASR
jgi:hypothetical protein